jgi:hypothetical protein
VLKKKHDGRYKARWVARGFKHEFGVVYLDVFASVARVSSYRLFFALASIFHLTFFQFDVKSAFLNGDLDEEIYDLPVGIRSSWTRLQTFEINLWFETSSEGMG